MENKQEAQLAVKYTPPPDDQLRVYASLACAQLDNPQAVSSIDTEAAAKDLARFLQVLGRLEAKRLNTENPN